MAEQDVIIIVAVNGPREADPARHVPVNAEEIVEDAVECFQAGASVLHFHGRDPVTGLPTTRADVYSDVTRRLGERCDMLVETTTGAGAVTEDGSSVAKRNASGDAAMPDMEARLDIFHVDPPQEMLSVAAGSWNLRTPSIPPLVYHNSPAYIERNCRHVQSRPRSVMNFEVADFGFLHNIHRLIDDGILAPGSRKFWMNYVLDFGGMAASARNLAIISDEGKRLFPYAPWGVLAPDEQHFPMAIAGAGMGCNLLRTGFEDVLNLPNGTPARKNVELVEALLRIVEASGRKIASPARAREILALA